MGKKLKFLLEISDNVTLMFKTKYIKTSKGEPVCLQTTMLPCFITNKSRKVWLLWDFKLLYCFILSKTYCKYVLYEQIGNRGAVKEAAGFNADADAQKLRDAMKGAGEWTSDKPSSAKDVSESLCGKKQKATTTSSSQAQEES